MAYTNAGIRRGYESGVLSGDSFGALHTAQPTNSNQIAAPGRVEFVSSEWEFAANYGRINVRQMFTTPTSAQSEPTHFGLWSASASGTLWGWFALSGIGALAANRDIIIEDEALIVRVSNTGPWTNEAIQLFLNSGLFAADRYYALHSDAPASGNEVDIDRVVLDSGNWTYSTNRATYNAALSMSDINQNIPSVTHWAIWDAATSGNILVTGSLSGEQTSIDRAGQINFAANQIYTELPLAA